MRVARYCLTVVCLVGAGQIASAQLPLTRVKSVYPPSGQVGTTFDLQLTSGDDLEEVAALHFTHPGITAAPKMQEVEGKQQPVDNQFVVTIAGNVPPGIYELRASGLWGVSNPQRFSVSARPLVGEAEPNNALEQAQAIAVNSSVFGRMDGGTDIDAFKFTAEAGQRIVFDCLSERLDSQMDADLMIRDANGRRVTWAHNTLGDDPTLVFDVPAAGEYVIEVHDHTYRNGQEYVYRLDIHTGPHIALVMPPAGQAATKSKFTLYGYNLPGGTKTEQLLNKVALEQLPVEIDVPREDAVLDLQNLVRSYESDVDAFSWTLDSPQGKSNPVRIGISDREAVLETEPNSEAAQANAITAPGEAAGQLSEQGDIDWYSFTGTPGQVYWIEVIGQRNGSTLDPVLVVEEVTKDANGAEQVKRLAQQDDDGTNVAQNVFDTFTDDPVYRLTAAANATYRVAVYDRYGQTRGSPKLRYRLCIRGEEPDFRVVAVPALNQNNTGVPWPVSLRKGDSVGVDVYALRKYGYEGPLDITVEGLPQGVTCAGTTIGTKENQGQIVFRSEESAPESVTNVRLIARATIEGPAAQRDAAKRLSEAEKPLADLRKKVDEARTKLEQAVQQRDDAAMKSVNDPANQGLANDLANKQKALDALQQPYMQATEALAAGEKAVTDARIALERTRTELPVSRRHVRHIVRTGTLMTPGQNNVAAEGRLAQSFALAVMKEPAPFALNAEPQRVTACQSRQILVPVSLVKRNGFDEKVQLTVAGVPKSSNLQVQNVAIEKGQSEAMVSILVKENTPPGTYALWINSQGQVSYSRNPEKTERIKAERDEVVKQLEQVQAEAKAATDAKNAAVQKATEAATKLQQAQQTKQQADQLVQTRTNELNAVKPQKDAADKKVEETAKAATDADAALKAAQEALAADAENEELKQKVTAAEAALTEAQKQAAEATAARDEQVKKLAEAEKLLTEATTAQTQAAEVVTQSETAKAEAEKGKTDAEAAEKAATDKVKPLDDKKKAFDKKVQDAEKVSNPQNKNFTPTTPPIIIDVVAAPVKLTPSVPNGGAVKAGESIEIGVKVDRLNGFAGPVTVALGLSPGVAGLSGEITIPADAAEGKLTVAAAADATEGEHKLVTVRATADQNGPQIVEVPVTIKVNK
ncbi:MAG: pre-peptidase C-terminal domain-containing protein [Planctomycetaceae bacterium]|nr:pre-peptidase C-terminal domain-containing protein [Planctomycetaceae bacterium]